MLKYNLDNTSVISMAQFMEMTPDEAKEIQKTKYESLLSISLRFINGTEEQKKHLNTLRSACGYPVK